MNPLHPRIASTLALAGIIVQLTGAFLAAHFYRGAQPTTYSPLNHFISELSWPRHSHLALVFKGCCMIGSALQFPLWLVLAREIGGRLATLGAFFGTVATAATWAVSFNSIDRLKVHLAAALVLFIAWPLTTLFFTAAIRSQRSRRFRAVAFAGIAAAVACLVFLLMPKPSWHQLVHLVVTEDRPRFVWVCLSEWSMLAFMLLWVFTAALALRRGKT